MSITILLFGVQTIFARTTGVVEGTTVNVRQEGSITARILKTAPPGTQIEVTAVAADGFYRVNVNGTTGAFIHSDFIAIQTAGGRINSQSVNIRRNPSTTGQILDRAAYGNEFTVTGTSGEWFAVEHNSERAYVHSDFLSGTFLGHLSEARPQTSQPAQAAQASPAPQSPASTPGTQNEHVIIISEIGVNFRTNSSVESDIILAIASGRPAQFLREQDGWYNIIYNGREGFVYSEFAQRRSGAIPETSITSSAPVTRVTVEAPSRKAQEIVDFAKQFLGTPYRFGGTDLRNGVDCSGFTFSVFRHFGINLHRVSRDQINNGTRVGRNELKIGDLVFFNVGGSTPISHVGLYTGGGRFIHSATGSQNRVIISSLYEPYYVRTFVGGSRILH